MSKTKSIKQTVESEEEGKRGAELVLQPENIAPAVNTSDWPLLLKDYDRMNVRTGHFTPLPEGHSPLDRPMEMHLKYGVINLDKPSNPSSHEVVAWVKKILKIN